MIVERDDSAKILTFAMIFRYTMLTNQPLDKRIQAKQYLK